MSHVWFFSNSFKQEEIGCLQSLKSKEEKDDASNSAKIKTEPEDGALKHTEDSTALKNAILGPQPPEEQPVATDAIPTVHSTKTEAISSGECQLLIIYDRPLFFVHTRIWLKRDAMMRIESNLAFKTSWLEGFRWVRDHFAFAGTQKNVDDFFYFLLMFLFLFFFF